MIIVFPPLSVLLGYLENESYFISLFQILNAMIDDVNIIMTGREYSNDVQMKFVRIVLGLISRETLKKLELSDVSLLYFYFKNKLL
jgi:hypothetical protein